MIATALAALASLAVPIWQDGLMPCNDGNRYTSGKAQPPPFHRRWCGWPVRALQAATLVSLVALGVLMGSPTKAVMLLTLPGAWFIATHPTTTDAPCMLLAWCAALLFPAHPYVALLLSMLAGFIHERGPVFAALYAWHPLLLLGLVAVGWWRTPAGRDKDGLVGHSTWQAIKAHRPYQDMLDPVIVALGLRAALAWPIYAGGSTRAWAALVMAFGSRIIGSDTCRFLFWAAPPLIADSPDAPLWVLGLHLVTFRRAI